MYKHVYRKVHKSYMYATQWIIIKWNTCKITTLVNKWDIIDNQTHLFIHLPQWLSIPHFEKINILLQVSCASSRPCPSVSLFSLSDSASCTLCIGTDLHKAVVHVCSLDGDHGSFISESPVSAQSLVPWRYPCWVNEWTMDEWGGIWIPMYLIPLIHSINCKWALFLLSWSPCFRVDGRWKRKGIN